MQITKHACVLVAALLLATGSAHAVTSGPGLVGQLGIIDLTANGGINPATGAAWADGDQYRLVFVSSTFRDAASHDIADYNAHVQAAANAAGIGSVTWNAIASTWDGDGGATVDARDNTSTNPGVDGSGVGIILIDGSTIIANDYNDLWDGTIDSQINRTESNGAYTPPLTSPFGQFGGVWAGTTASGTNRGVASLGGPRADLGLAIAVNSQWIRRADINPHDNASLGLYAMSEALTIRGPSGAIPEPATATIALVGLSGLLLRRRR